MALGGLSGGVMTKGRIIEFDDGSGSGTIAAGMLRLQDATSFSLASLQPNYAFGLDGSGFQRRTLFRLPEALAVTGTGASSAVMQISTTQARLVRER